MAPRPDAPIHRLRAGADPQPPAPDAPAEAPDPQGARYYSVHRAAGRQPDPTPLPQPFFLDAPPVDLAEPPAQPAIIRDAQGRSRPSALVDEPQLP
jgi:hypothetical protein